MSGDGYHVPIMVHEVMELLRPERGGVFVDGTLGGCGHSRVIFESLPQDSSLFGIDRDTDAISRAPDVICAADTGKAFTAIHGNFFNMKELLCEQGVERVDGILLDLGVSSHQLDEPERGFSYMADAPLDMRMNRDDSFSAYDVVNGYSHSELARIFREYGEERYAGKVASAILKSREQSPIETTAQLVSIIKSAMPPQALREKQHPAKRVFQSIRIEVNGELQGLRAAIDAAAELLNPEGVLAVITFHSLEDRIAKQAFVAMEKPCICDPKAPICTCGKQPTAKILTRKPIVASDDEIEANPRARSAKLRVIRKL